MDTPRTALEDLVVVDLTHYVAGPFCTKMFADFGASVIKVEKPGQGDGARELGPFPGDAFDPEASGLFLNLNTNKLGVTLNLKTDEGRRILLDLARSADILVENFRPGVMDGLGLGWDTLHAANPKLIMTSISNFGQTGPYRDYKATDLILYGMGGLSGITGARDREPLKGPQAQSQYQAGLFAFMATLCAVLARGFIGEGQRIDVAMLESVASIILPTLLRAVASGTKQQRGELVKTIPCNFFRCKDGFIYLYAPGEVLWGNLAAALEIDPSAMEDPRFSTGKARFENADALAKLLEPSLMSADRETLFNKLKEMGLIAGPALTMDEVFAMEHLQERNFFVEVKHPRTGTLKYPGPPFRMTETPWQIRSPAPLLGQHNRQVFVDKMGFTDDDLAKWTREGIV